MLKVPSVVRPGFLALVALLGPIAAAAQARPSQEQVQQALQSNPSLAATVRSRITSSGMSADQVRARLRSAGYSESLLDAYLPGAKEDASIAPDANVMRAVQFLGLVDRADTPVEAPAVSPGLAAVALAEEAPKSRIHGLDVFRRATSQFEPDLAGPVDATYKLGPRDMLAVILTGGVENSYTLEVTREGFVVIPQVGQIYVSNLTLEQATDLLYRRLRNVYSGLGRGADASTKLFVTVARLRANQVFVIGDVMRPGSYQVSSAGTMLTALYSAGGPNDNGNLRTIQLRRGDKVVSTLDLYAYLDRGESTSDLRLETGDVLFVPVHGPRVEIRGQVTRPAIYEMAPGETLDALIQLAGGFQANANQSRVLVRRILPPEQRKEIGRDQTVLDVGAEAFSANSRSAFRLEDGDVVDVFPVASKVRNRITVGGAVWTPGNQGFTPGMTLSDAIKLAGGVRSDVKNVQISRLQFDQTRRELRTAVRDTLGTPVDDISLQEDDQITVFATSDFRPDRYVAITGAVREGGRFPYREGMTLRDLLHYAGGLADGAYLDRAEIARLPENRTSGMLAQSVSVSLDSTYLLERGLDGKYVGPPGLATRANGAPEVELMPYDNVLILRQPDFVLDRTVTLTGEVRFPGNYVLQTKSERVADVIRRAGGLTPEAYPLGAVYNRAQNRIGRIGFDLERVMRDARFRDNIVMMHGDTLYVPPARSVVDVRGAVHSPIAVAYSPGKNINYYIAAAGGETYDADKNRAYVQQPNGVVEPYKKRAFLIPDRKPDPLPGSVVVVPVKDPNDKKDWTAIIGSVAQVLANTIAIVAVIGRL